MKTTSLLCCVLLSTLTALAVEPIRLLIPEYVPYTSYQGGKASGIGVEKVTALLNAAGIPCLISGASYDDAVEAIKADKADGFFLASQNRARDQVAVLFAPVVYNTWNWYLPADSKLDPAAPDFAQSVIVGAVAGSNPAAWLTQHDFHVRLVPDASGLPAMLHDHKGITAIMGPELVINDAIAKAGLSAGQFKVVVQDRKPFGLYLSKKWVAAHPELAAKIKDLVAAAKP